MTRLTWDAVGERTFEVGVDRGVLFVDGEAGVPWNGLVSVSETPSGGEVTPYYIDTIKYKNYVASEEFAATIAAFSYPKAFQLCEGTAHVANGLYAGQQKKRSFDFSYRTKVGNDVDGEDHGYKIHLVYNAVTAPTERTNLTVGDTVEPAAFSWKVATKPPMTGELKPTAHFVIDSRETHEQLLEQIEDILYGSESNEPRLPDVDELLAIFEDFAPA